MLSSFGKNLNIVIVGVSGGIGRALVESLMTLDNIQLVHGLSRKPVSFDNPKFHHHFIDYNDEAVIQKVSEDITEAAPVDIILVATGLLHDESGVAPEKSLRNINSDNFAKVFLTNSTGPALIMKHFLPKLNREGKTLYAAISARVGSISDNQLGGWYAYRASKAALNMLIKTASIEVARKHKQACVIGLHPGTVETPLSEPFKGNVSKEKLFTPEYSANCLIKVIDDVTPEDTGLTFAFDGQKIPF